MDPKPIETSLILTFLRRNSARAPEIAVQSREVTGAGFYTRFSVDSELRERKQGELATGPMRGPEIASPELPNGAGSLLWPSESGVHTLEVYTYSDELPEDLLEFSLGQS
jgi:hypothetical protein